MTETSREAARQSFGDLLALFDTRSAGAQELVAGATALLVAGVDGPAVVALASAVLTPMTSPFRVDDVWPRRARSWTCRP